MSAHLLSKARGPSVLIVCAAAGPTRWQEQRTETLSDSECPAKHLHTAGLREVLRVSGRSNKRTRGNSGLGIQKNVTALPTIFQCVLLQQRCSLASPSILHPVSVTSIAPPAHDNGYSFLVVNPVPTWLSWLLWLWESMPNVQQISQPPREAAATDTCQGSLWGAIIQHVKFLLLGAPREGPAHLGWVGACESEEDVGALPGLGGGAGKESHMEGVGSRLRRVDLVSGILTLRSSSPRRVDQLPAVGIPIPWATPALRDHNLASGSLGWSRGRRW